MRLKLAYPPGFASGGAWPPAPPLSTALSSGLVSVDLSDDEDVVDDDDDAMVGLRSDESIKWMSCDRCGKWRNCSAARGGMREDGPPGTFYCEWSNDADYNSCDREQEHPDGIIDMLLGHDIGYDGEGDGPAAVVVEAAAAAEAEERLLDVSLTVAAEGHVHVSLTTAPTKKRKYEAVRLRLQGVTWAGAEAEAAAAAVAASRPPYVPPVEEAEGLRLHMSTSVLSKTGYRGVSLQRVKGGVYTGRYVATFTLAMSKIEIGVFDTAVEAAVAYARHVGSHRGVGEAAIAPPPPLLQRSTSSEIWDAATDFEAELRRARRQKADAGRAQDDAPPRDEGSSSMVVDAGDVEEDEDGMEEELEAEASTSSSSSAAVVPASVVSHAEGLQLHLNSKNATGYEGVNYISSKNADRGGTFRAIRKGVYIGCFATAVEAAVAGAGTSASCRWRRQRRRSQCPVVSHAEGLQLYLSP